MLFLRLSCFNALPLGIFLQCRKEAKWKHWFHSKCFNTDRSGDPLCPHCGEKSEQHEIKLKLKVFETAACERVLGESGDRVVVQVGGTPLTTTSASTSTTEEVKSASINQLVPTANPPKRAKMCFEQYFQKTGKGTSVNAKGKTKIEPEKFQFDESLVVNVKRADGSEFKFRHMPLGLPADIMVRRMVEVKD